MKKIGWQFGWKLFSVDENNSNVYHPAIIKDYVNHDYVLRKSIRRKRGYGPFTLFKTREEAREYKRGIEYELIHGPKTVILKIVYKQAVGDTLYVPITRKTVGMPIRYAYYNKQLQSIRRGDLPNGTILADEFTIIYPLIKG